MTSTFFFNNLHINNKMKLISNIELVISIIILFCLCVLTFISAYYWHNALVFLMFLGGIIAWIHYVLSEEMEKVETV